MSYYKSIELSETWLISIQNKDNHGWGLNVEQEPSIVNTAEAIFVLKRNGKHVDNINLGFDYIKSNLNVHLEQRGNRTRYVQFALLNLTDNRDQELNEFVNENTSFLLDARNQDGGWGFKSKDQMSQLYSTCISLLLFEKFGFKMKTFESAYNLILSKRVNGLWSFNENGPISATATAIATLALMTNNEISFERKGIEDFLLKNQNWGTEIENMPGANWEHSSYMWIFPALIKLGQAPHCLTITRGINSLEKLKCPNGWLEPNGSLTVRGNFWAVFALDSLTRKFDPVEHSHKIHSDSWLHFNVNNSWTTIVPSKLYKLISYTIFVLAILLFLELNRSYGNLPRYVDFVLSLILFAITIWLIYIRRDHFSKWIKLLIGSVATIIPLFQAITGKSILDIFNFLK